MSEWLNLTAFLRHQSIHWGPCNPWHISWKMHLQCHLQNMGHFFMPHCVKQGKSEGFESCDRPIVRKRPIWVKIDYFFSRVTLKFEWWPSKTIGHLFYATSSLVHHFVAIGEFRLELQSGNAQSGSKWTIFLAVWPWNLTDDLENQ